VNVIGHHGVGVQIDEPLLLDVVKYGHDALGDARLPKPARAGFAAIEGAVEIEKALAGHVFRGDGSQMGRQRTFEAPGDKDILAGWMPVGKVPSVECHHS
jgi:hypothetical protein